MPRLLLTPFQEPQGDPLQLHLPTAPRPGTLCALVTPEAGTPSAVAASARTRGGCGAAVQGLGQERQEDGIRLAQVDDEVLHLHLQIQLLGWGKKTTRLLVPTKKTPTPGS